MPEGVFHDAHEVYWREPGTEEWQWTATFATKKQADGYKALMARVSGDTEYEVRAV